MNDTEALVILVNTPSIGAVKARLLIEFFGSPSGVLQASNQDLLNVPGIGAKIADRVCGWRERSDWQRDLELIDRYKVQLISWQHPAYPRRLLNLPDHPILLYVCGEAEELQKPSIAIVGTRTASIYGMETAERFSEELAGQGFSIVSGLARGIDTACHKAALKSGTTAAVLGSGIANIYPKENERLAQAIIQNGAVISEFPMAASPERHHFPQRNRIVAGMSVGTLLIEAPEESGAMLTMERASKEGRQLWAIPGRIDTPYFSGNHRLIKEGKAALVEHPREILSTFQNHFPKKAAREDLPLKRVLPLEPEEQNLYNALPDDERTIDEIVQLTQVPIKKLNILLVSLVLKQIVREYPGKVYKKVSCTIH